MKIEFIKSPTGEHNLAYNVGGVWDCTDETFAKMLINTGYANEVPKKAKKIVPKKVSKITR